jgi:hypothetical protein
MTGLGEGITLEVLEAEPDPVLASAWIPPTTPG